MAEDLTGQRKDGPRSTWTKIFTTFKVALDVKKLLLAAAGILAMSLGWFVLSLIFRGGGQPPKWSEYSVGTETEAQKAQAWESFKTALRRYNLRHEMAGNAVVGYGIGDVAGSLDEYLLLEKIETAARLPKVPVAVKVKTDGIGSLTIEQKDWTISIDPKDTASIEKLKDRTFKVEDLRVVDAKEGTLSVGGTTVKVVQNLETLNKDFISGVKTLGQVQAELLGASSDKALTRRAFKLYDDYLAMQGRAKPFGRLSTWPWFEYRGPNPYLLVSGNVTSKGTDGTRAVPWQRGGFLGWLLSDQVPVLLEPLMKFLAPVVYLFHPDAGGWNRIYLILIILWTIAVWGFFGGAISRMAAVQLARNEKVGMREALAFARERCQSYFSAPLFPLVFLGILSLFLLIFGFLEAHTYFFGDIVLAGLLWPVVLIFGLIMAVVLVGLVGYPLMNPTISTEGSDSFDALSRSYSYVYQAPWQYIWYCFLALVYGAVLVFFVGFMGSLMVYLGKWGMSQAPWMSSADPARDREPSYLFVNAPTSFGWRDLLLRDSQFAESQVVVSPGGVPTVSYRLSDTYMSHMSWSNWIGAFLVSIWLYLFFLLIVGFGYSYFWTASTLIYLFMRRHVDDTDLDEIHLEEEEGDTFASEPAGAPAPAPKPEGPAGFAMVESPTLRAPADAGPKVTPPAEAGEKAPPAEGAAPAGEGPAGASDGEAVKQPQPEAQPAPSGDGEAEQSKTAEEEQPPPT